MKIFDLSRFIFAQENRDTFSVALHELQNGKKVSHWIWFVFPQLQGLAKSPTSDYFGISGIAEAKAYMDDPILSSRLIEAVQAMLQHREKTAAEVLGHTDSKKFQSSMTLFREAAPDISVFDDALGMFYAGKPDYQTLRLLGE